VAVDRTWERFRSLFPDEMTDRIVARFDRPAAGPCTSDVAMAGPHGSHGFRDVAIYKFEKGKGTHGEFSRRLGRWPSEMRKREPGAGIMV